MLESFLSLRTDCLQNLFVGKYFVNSFLAEIEKHVFRPSRHYEHSSVLHLVALKVATNFQLLPLKSQKPFS